MYYQKKIFAKPLKKVRKRVLRSLKTLCDKAFFNRYLRNDIPVLVYQMGKVGSSSVSHSLSHQYPGVVLQAHYFKPNHKDWRVRRLYHWVMEGGGSLNIISLTREPIGRNVSAFFQNFEKRTGVPYHKANFSLEELKAIFLKEFAKGQPLHWFEINIMGNFGIDVYVKPFPECGHSTYSHKNIRLLVMRSEIANQRKAKVIRDFLSLDTFQITNRNISADKQYSATYMDFKKNVKLPSDYINTICKSKYFNHFYDRETVDNVKQKWCEKD